MHIRNQFGLMLDGILCFKKSKLWNYIESFNIATYEL